MTEREGEVGLLLDLRSVPQEREIFAPAVDPGFVFLWTEGTICFGMNFNQVLVIPDTKIVVCLSTIIFFENNLHLPRAPLNIGAGAMSPIRQEN